MLSFWPTALITSTLPLALGWGFYNLNMIQAEVLDFLEEVTSNSSDPSSRPSSYSDKTILLYSNASSIMFLGGIIGSNLAAYLSDRFGRRPAILVHNLLSCFGGTLIMLAKPFSSAAPLVLGRLVYGLGFSGITAIVTMYLSEIATLKTRGLMASSFIVSSSVGAILLYICTTEKTLGTEQLWWISPGFIWVFSLPYILGYRLIPESPIYLKNLGQIEKSEEMVNHLYPKQNQSGLDMQVSISNKEREGKEGGSTRITLKDLKSDSQLHKALIYVLLLTLGENMTGMMMLSFYSQRIVLTFNLSKFSTQLITIALAVVRLVAALAGSTSMQKFTRRSMFMLSHALLVAVNLSMCVLGLVPSSLAVQILQIISVIVGISSWSYGAQPLLFVMPNEILPIKYRSLGARLVSTVAFLLFYVQAFAFPKLELLIGSYVFLIFGFCGVVNVTYFHFRFIESRHVPSVECFEKFAQRGYF